MQLKLTVYFNEDDFKKAYQAYEYGGRNENILSSEWVVQGMMQNAGYPPEFSIKESPREILRMILDKENK